MGGCVAHPAQARLVAYWQSVGASRAEAQAAAQRVYPTCPHGLSTAQPSLRVVVSEQRTTT